MEKNSFILRQLASSPIYLYKWLIRPMMRPCCRYYPSCSDYALTAIEYYGVLKGIKLSCLRLLRCHPWSASGYDPVVNPPVLSNSDLLNKEK